MRAAILEKSAKLNRQAMINSASVTARDSLRVESGQVWVWCYCLPSAARLTVYWI